jgi:hypothetical protein
MTAHCVVIITWTGQIRPATGSRAANSRVPSPKKMNGHPHAKSASQAKHRNYAHLSKSLARLSRAMGQTAALFEQLHLDLDAMRTLAGIHSAQ